MVMGYLEEIKNEEVDSDIAEIIFKSLFKSTTALNLTIFIFYSISFALKLTYCFNNEKDYFDINGDEFKYTYSIASYYNQVFYFESLLFASVVIKIFTFLKLNDKIKLYFSSIELGMTIFVKYSIFFVTIFIGYACIANIIWGPYLEEFAIVGDSFLIILLFTMGKKNYLLINFLGYFSPNKLLEYSQGWALVFVTSFYVFVIFFLYVIFVSIYAESLRRTVIKTGYPSDNQLSQWILKDYVIWLCYCFSSTKKTDEKTG
jgi:hypothetical protein